MAASTTELSLNLQNAKFLQQRTQGNNTHSLVAWHTGSRCLEVQDSCASYLANRKICLGYAGRILKGPGAAYGPDIKVLRQNRTHLSRPLRSVKYLMRPKRPSSRRTASSSHVSGRSPMYSSFMSYCLALLGPLWCCIEPPAAAPPALPPNPAGGGLGPPSTLLSTPAGGGAGPKELGPAGAPALLPRLWAGKALGGAGPGPGPMLAPAAAASCTIGGGRWGGSALPVLLLRW